MTFRDLCSVRWLSACVTGFAFGVGGCSRPTVESIPEPPPAVQIVDPAAPDPATPPAPPAPTFSFQPDLTGKELPRVVVPGVGGPLRGERSAPEPKTRSVPKKVADPDALASARYSLPPLPPPRRPGARPAAPAEKLPANFSAAGEDPSARPILPVALIITEKARDVNVPPPAPVLGRPAPDRVSLDDPTSDLANAEVVAGVVKTPLAPSAFLKVTIPDPFELAGQLKPSVPPSLAPAPEPVPVNPERPK